MAARFERRPVLLHLLPAPERRGHRAADESITDALDRSRDLAGLLLQQRPHLLVAVEQAGRQAPMPLAGLDHLEQPGGDA